MVVKAGAGGKCESVSSNRSRELGTKETHEFLTHRGAIGDRDIPSGVRILDTLTPNRVNRVRFGSSVPATARERIVHWAIFFATGASQQPAFCDIMKSIAGE